MSDQRRDEPTPRVDIVPDMIFDLRRETDSSSDDHVRREEREVVHVEPARATTPAAPIHGTEGDVAPTDEGRPEVAVVHITTLKQVASIGDLIELVFRKATKPKLSKKQARLLDVGDLAEDDVARRLDDLFAIDPALKGLIRALWVVEDSDLSARLQAKILDAIEICLVRHPLIPGWNVQRVIGADEHQVLEAVRTLRSSIDAEHWRARWPEGAKPADQQAFARNVVIAAVLVWALRSGTGLGATSELLDEGVWSQAGGGRSPSKAPLMVALAESSAGRDLHLLYGALSEAVLQERARAAEAVEVREVEAQARESVELELKSAVVFAAELESRILQLEAELSTSMKALRDASEAARIALAHAADDFEKLRAGTFRGVTKEVSMLKDALGALEDERSKVAIDFVSRAIEGLEGEVESLRAAERLRETGS